VTNLNRVLSVEKNHNHFKDILRIPKNKENFEVFMSEYINQIKLNKISFNTLLPGNYSTFFNLFSTTVQSKTKESKNRLAIHHPWFKEITVFSNKWFTQEFRSLIAINGIITIESVIQAVNIKYGWYNCSECSCLKDLRIQKWIKHLQHERANHLRFNINSTNHTEGKWNWECTCIELKKNEEKSNWWEQ
jgi:hypothetical protein